MSPVSRAVRVVVDVTADLIHRNEQARRGRVLVHGGLTDDLAPADGCPRCGAVIHVWLSHGRWLLWCDHSPSGWQWRRDETVEVEAA